MCAHLVAVLYAGCASCIDHSDVGTERKRTRASRLLPSLFPKVSWSRYFIRPQTHRFSVWYCPAGSAGEFCICLGRRVRSLCAAGRSESSWYRREPGPTLRSEPVKRIMAEIL